MGSALGVPFHRVSVRLDEPALRDVGAHTDRALASCGVVLEPGSEVAIALGSRGIVDLQLVVRRVIAWVREPRRPALRGVGDGKPRRRNR